MLRPGGRLAFFTISVADGLSAADRRRATAAGPPSPDDARVSETLRRVGFSDVRDVDVTAEYLATTRAWLAARTRHRASVRPVDPEVFDSRVAQGLAAAAAIEDGLLRRTLHTARVAP